MYDILSLHSKCTTEHFEDGHVHPPNTTLHFNGGMVI